MVELKPIAVGTGVLLAAGALAVVLVGPISAVPALLISGILGGTATGLANTVATEMESALQRGGFLGLYASGLGGLVIFAAFLVMDVASMAGDGDVLLLFVASPLAVVFFALEGLLGGYLGGGLGLLYRRQTSAD